VGRAGGKFQLTEVAVDDDYSPHHSDVYEDDYDIHYESGRGYCLPGVFYPPHTHPLNLLSFSFFICVLEGLSHEMYLAFGDIPVYDLF
jgi:hypothetical protein